MSQDDVLKIVPYAEKAKAMSSTEIKKATGRQGNITYQIRTLL
ncbi:MAG: hypothetical protein WAW52_05435 [Methanothrix sp.]